ncbi:helix-turn-helix domain-containing protein [Bacillus solitudinis]|uniref:helix-turn-helix domain-containing protein n=1 Tax=Bacillus solitudinis TaxID=2014074 RepID=UPI000C23DAD7|nr:helix-turn-helix transcriptional regulator [Bacillus solitudinis]
MEASNWGRRIRAFRKLKGYTQEGFAKAIGVSVSVLGEIERGVRDPDDHLIDRITNVLKVSRNEMTYK